MNKTEELIETINKYPEHELIFMYPDEGSDYSYTMGYPDRILVDEYWAGDDRVWLRYDDEIEMEEHYVDTVFDDLYPHVQATNEGQDKIIEKKIKEFIGKQEWKKCICVRINY